MLEQLKKTGNLDPKILEIMDAAKGDPSQMGRLLEALQGMAGPEMEKPLDIADHYREGDGRKFDLKWEIGPGNPLPIPFDSLDRKTQFFTLFAEWQRRETGGMMALTNGKLEEAEGIFNECIQRAEQIEVGELKARSYEGLMRVAQRRNDNKAVLRLSKQAQAARASG